MSLSVTNPSYDRVYPMYAWRDNNVRLVLTQGEGATTLDGTAARIKAPRFQLRDDQGVMDLSGSPVISLALTRPDKSEDLLACTIIDATNGIISCPITASATAIAGQAVGEIRLSSTNGTIKFFGVHALIYDGVSNSAAAQSTQFSALVDALQKVATVDPDGSNTVTLDSAIAENGTNPVASGVIYAALQVLDNAKIDKDKAVKYTGSNDLSECVDNGVLYRVHDGTTYQILLCNSGDAYRVQYMFKRSGEVVFRTSAKSNDTWGAWSTWSPIGTTSNIADGAVTSDKLGSSSVTTEKINDGAVTTAKLASGAVTSDKIAASVVTSGIIYDYLQGNYRQISFAHENNESSYDDGGVYIDDATDIAKMYYVKNSNGARVGILFCVRIPGYNYGTQVKIDAYGNITTRVKTQESGEADYTWKSWTPVGTTRNIQDGAVTESKVGNGAITTDKIHDSAVNTNKIADSAVTAEKIAVGAVTENELADDAVETEKINNGAVTVDKIGNGAVSTDKIYDGAVTTPKINNGAVTSDKLGSSSVTTEKINDGAVTSAKVADNAIQSGHINDGAVGTSKLASGAITPEKMGFRAVKYVTSVELDSCIDGDTVYEVRATDANGTTGRHTVICVPATYQRTQYLFAQEGGVQFRKAFYSNDTWGAWSSWVPLTPKTTSFTVSSSGWSGLTYSMDSGMPSYANQNTKVDINLSDSVYNQLIADGCMGLYVTTETSGNTPVFTLHAVGNAPTANITIQLMLQQVS